MIRVRQILTFPGALVVVLLLLSSGLAQAPDGFEPETVTAKVRYGDGRSSQSVTLKRLVPDSNEWFIAGSDLADILQVGRYWRFDVRKLVLRIDGNRITFTVGARSVVGGERTILLRQEVAFDAGEPWIPMEFLREVLPQLSERSVGWDPDTLLLSLGEQSYNVTSMGIRTEGLFTELRIKMSSPLAFRVDDSRPRHLFLKIYGGRADRDALRLGRPQGLIESVGAQQERTAAVVEIQLSELASKYQSLSEDGGKTVVLRVEQAPITTIPDPVPRGPHLVQTLPPEAKGRKVEVRKVIIDAGHGGADIGRAGVGGLLEKDVTLAIAREVERVLRRERDIEVVLTRREDADFGLVERTEMANQESGDVFISIHCNGWYNSAANGVETYFLSPAKTEWDADVARAENAAVGAAEDLDFILWDLVQNLYIQESATLAEAVQQRMSNDLKLRNRGVKQAGFRVLVGAYMPAILVEVGFLSHAEESKRLGSASFQRDIARALADAILDFRARMDAVREESP
jgi:N-acetylmuramoyl-L-alanine amidase